MPIVSETNGCGVSLPAGSLLPAMSPGLCPLQSSHGLPNTERATAPLAQCAQPTSSLGPTRPPDIAPCLVVSFRLPLLQPHPLPWSLLNTDSKVPPSTAHSFHVALPRMLFPQILVSLSLHLQVSAQLSFLKFYSFIKVFLGSHYSFSPYSLFFFISFLSTWHIMCSLVNCLSQI